MSRMVKNQAPFVESFERRQPSALTAKVIEPIQVQSTATTIVTAQTGTDFWVTHLCAANVSGAATTYTVYFVENGGSAGTANMVIHQRTLAAYATEVIAPAINHRIPEGAKIQALCTANNDVNIFGWGYDQTGEPV